MDDLDDHEENAQKEIDEYHALKKHQELRIECSSTESFLIRLDEGTAEIFGAELHRGVSINVAGQKLAVFTWQGCKIHVKGMKPESMYIVSETPMISYMNAHTILNNKRKAALDSGKRGPHCIFLGPTDCGKSTLSRMFCNWAVRSGWEPMVVDLDVGQGSISAPGCVAATPIESPVDIEEGYPLEMPLVYFLGHATPSDNPELYKFLVDRLAGLLQRRAEADPKAAASGLIINTLGWIEGLGYELQIHSILSLKADNIFVLEQDRLYSQVSAEFRDKKEVEVIKLIKSGGVVKREKEDRRQSREQRIHDYFYGTASNPLVPVTQTARADQLMVYRIGGGPRAPSSTLPIGAQSVADPLRLTNLPASAELSQSLLAVSHAPSADQILSTNIAGFILVKDVDAARGTVTYLSPSPGNLPGRYLVTGSIRSSLN